MKKSDKKAKTAQIVTYIMLLAVGGLCGFFLPLLADTLTPDSASFGLEMIILALILLAVVVLFFIQIIIHEAGHLVFGLLSGYKFVSFRILSFMVIKQNGKLKFCRFSLAGTGGQCLMSPPGFTDGRIPVFLYNFGGVFANIIVSAIAGAILFILPLYNTVSVLLIIFVIVGLSIALTNGIPMHSSTVDNDGYNALSLGKNRDAMRAFWLQLKVNEQSSNAIRCKDMPDEWFVLPNDEDMGNSMVAASAVFYANRLFDAHKFEEADKVTEHILSIESAIVPLYRALLVCDRVYMELIGENRREVIDKLYTDPAKKIMKAMKNFPSVIRTEFAYALLYEGDSEKAAAVKKRFLTCIKHYPQPAEQEAEKELIALAEQKADRI